MMLIFAYFMLNNTLGLIFPWKTHTRKHKYKQFNFHLNPDPDAVESKQWLLWDCLLFIYARLCLPSKSFPGIF